MKQHEFNRRIKKFIEELNLTKSPNSKTDATFIDTILWPFFEDRTIERLNDACKWLVLNFPEAKYNKFPQVYEFRKGLEATDKKTFSNYNPGDNPTKEELEESRRMLKQLSEKYRVKE